MANAESSSSAQVYVVNGAPGQSSIPAWLVQRSRNKKNAKRTTTKTLGSIELVQHFEFPEASLKIKTSPDGRSAIATGVYKPQIRVYDLDQLTLKFERHTDAENVDFQILSDDWTKSIHLQTSRHIDLHTQGGLHHRTRVPKEGRAITYHSPSCDALVGATGSEVYRLNLEQGRFLTPFDMLPGTGGVNALDVNPRHGLLAFGTERGEDGGCVEFWDPRSRDRIGVLSMPTDALRPVVRNYNDIDAPPPLAVTALSSKLDGLSIAVGTSTGHTLLYDLRSPKPFAMKDQGFSRPIKKLQWIEGGQRIAREGLIASADDSILKIWDKEDPSNNFVSLNPPTKLNDFHHLPGSGMIMVANEGVHMTNFYVPQLGPAPKWCSFLDNVTEEMADHQGGSMNQYQDFKFVERSEMSSLGLDHLIGTPTVKPYLHGFFISLKLYDSARLIANPQAHAEHRERLIADKIQEKAESRIRARRDEPKVSVNKALAEKVRREEERRKTKLLNANGDDDGLGAGESLLQDPRFKKVWEDKAFEIDTNSREFMLKNPSGSTLSKKGKTAVELEDEESDRVSSDPDDDDSESDANSEDSDAAGDLSNWDPRTMAKSERPSYRPEPEVQRTSRPKLVSVRDEDGAYSEAPASSSSKSNKSDSFGKRIKDQVHSKSNGKHPASQLDPADDRLISSKFLPGGGVEVSFIPSSGGKKGKGDDALVNDSGKEARDALRLKNKGVEKLSGSGFEKLTGEDDTARLSEEQRHGRQKRRIGARSASGNTFRGIQ